MFKQFCEHSKWRIPGVLKENLVIFFFQSRLAQKFSTQVWDYWALEMLCSAGSGKKVFLTILQRFFQKLAMSKQCIIDCTEVRIEQSKNCDRLTHGSASEYKTFNFWVEFHPPFLSVLGLLAMAVMHQITLSALELAIMVITLWNLT